MRLDELKALRLRRTQIRAELARIDALIGAEGREDEPPPRPKPIGDDMNTIRNNFYRDAENDFRNAGPNGNYE